MTAVESRNNERGRSGDSSRVVRAALLIDHPAQQFSRAFQLLDRHPEIDLRVYYWDAAMHGLPDPGFGRQIRWNVDMHSGYDWWSPTAEDSPWRRRRATLRQLSEDRPEVILCYGWRSPIARLGIFFAAVSRTPLLYYGDSTWQHSAGKCAFMRKVMLRTLFRLGSGAISTGTFNREFYISNGLDPQRIYRGVCPADTEFFSLVTESSERAPSAHGLVIGFAGKFLADKAPDDLIEAAARLPRDRPWELWLIGDGPLRSRLESLVLRRFLADRVRFFGFKNTDELPLLMKAMDVMVIPSRRDFRALVSIEAMAAGAAIVVSSGTAIWGAGDLVEHGETGLVYPAGDIDTLTSRLRLLMDDAELRKRVATAGRTRALSFGPKDFASTTTEALLAAARRR